MEENKQEEILKVILDRMNQEDVWFTSKEDDVYGSAKNLFKLDEYGDLNDKSKERLIKEVEDLLGDGATYLIEAVDQWIQDNLIQGTISYKDNLHMNYTPKEISERVTAYQENGIEDLELGTLDEKGNEKKLESKSTILNMKDLKVESKKLQESNNEDIMNKLNQLCNEYSPYMKDKTRQKEIQQEVKQILQDAPDGTEMYRVGKETTSGWTSHGSYSDERTVLRPYIKENGVWKMNGRTKKDLDDAVLGILYNYGEFKSKESAEEEKKELHADFMQSDLFEKMNPELFDIIVSNPPYIRQDVIETLMPEVRDYEPLLALDGREDGLYFYRAILKQTGNYLTRGGMLFFEIGYDQGQTVKELMKAAGYAEVEVIQDFAGLDRVVWGIRI